MKEPKYMTSAQIRELFLSFFESKGHLRAASHPIPVYNDPTLMFSVAGMTQFKPYFIGAEPNFPGKGVWRRVTTSQKCIRIGDIENVGRTDRHCSFFEMLGNFSFDSYFKKEAIEWAWEFLTAEKWLGLDPTRMYVTIYKDDDEAHEYWTGVGLPASKIHRFDADENFWPQNAPSKGPNGPCGPCSEIYYDRGLEYGTDTWAEYEQNPESNRFLEIWNLVFPGYNRTDGPDGTGALEDLGRKNIDTGMGMVRVVGIMQGVRDFYDSDDFKPLIAEVEKLSGKSYDGPSSISHRVIAEHVRMVSMTLADGVTFGNTGRGYVVRKVMRRASRHAYLLGMKEPVIYKLVGIVAQTLGQHYPEIVERQENVAKQIRQEEERFLKTLETGVSLNNERIAYAIFKTGAKIQLGQNVVNLILDSRMLEQFSRLLEPTTANLWDYAVRFVRENGEQSEKIEIERQNPNTPLSQAVLSGEDAFRLYDTYGFPIDLTIEIAEEYGVKVDVEGYEKAFEAAQNLARAGSKYKNLELFSGVSDVLEGFSETRFVGYDHLETESKVLGIIVPAQGGNEQIDGTDSISRLNAGSSAQVILEPTPFYAEGGGQVGDSGRLEWDGGAAEVLNTIKTPQGVYLHQIRVLDGVLEDGSEVRAKVGGVRKATERHHTATHLLQAALRATLGSSVQQKGSLVAPDRLRFDFSHNEAMTPDEIRRVEQLVNRWIEADFPVSFKLMAIDEARKTGAMALFGEKYGDVVRVVSVDGNVSSVGILEPATEVSSKELCGGTHVTRTGEIGAFVIVSEEGTAAGVRRLEALCGEPAIAFVRDNLERVRHVSRLLNATPETLEDRVNKLQDEIKARDKEIVGLRQKLVQAQTAGGASADVLELGGFKIARLELAGVSGNELRGAADDLLEKSKADIVVVGSDGGLTVKATKDAVGRGAHAGNLIGKLAAAGGGKGGGRPDMAQAGVKDVKAALGALETAFA
jgi:alanyl-tRNA synthetase